MAKIQKPKVYKQSKIPSSAIKPARDYNQSYGRFAFRSTCENHCLLADWGKPELSELIKCFKKFEKLQWKEIIKDSGFQYESPKQVAIKPPSTLPPDASLDSIRVNQRMRLFGYRTQDIFNIIWFDKDHMVCPMDKEKKYAL